MIGLLSTFEVEMKEITDISRIGYFMNVLPNHKGAEEA